ncbi:MAG: PaaI family thioesterase [Chloroflexi bacterium]|nr:PaaI family thioesterase [Chloroflexota bacterium]
MVSWSKIVEKTTGDGFSRQCFGCGEENPVGLRLAFQHDGTTARAEFTPSDLWQGWAGVVHGGIIACLLDEAMGHAAAHGGIHCVTAKMEALFRNPAPVDETLIITGSVTRRGQRALETVARICLRDGTIVAEGTGIMYILKSKDNGQTAESEST